MATQLRALLSVYDKSGLVEFARGLSELGFELVASGGTARALSQAGLAVTQVDAITGFPEILGGRVKTLHPAVHGGILARRTPEHLAELAAHAITPIGLVACNLYPFSETVSRPDVEEAQAIEDIDIGGVTLLRAAAKNFELVIVICDPADYAGVLAGLRADAASVGAGASTGATAADDPGALRQAHTRDGEAAGAAGEGAGIAGPLDKPARRRLALKAFRHTAAYDAAIASWLTGQVEPEEKLPEALNLAAERVQLLRYGENPHQAAALYRWAGSRPLFEQLQGKELSYNNIVDLEAAWAMPQEFGEPAVAIIKHTNPSGLASAGSLVEAYRLAFECDPVSAYGSIIAANREVDLALVEAIGSLFVEVLAAPSLLGRGSGVAGPAQEELPGHAGPPGGRGGAAAALGARRFAGPDAGHRRGRRGRLAGGDGPAARRGRDGGAALRLAGGQARQVQRDRVRARHGDGGGRRGADEPGGLGAPGRLAGRRAGTGRGDGLGCLLPVRGRHRGRGRGGRDGVHPAGWLDTRDADAIAAADRLGMTMIFTGERHFRH